MAQPQPQRGASRVPPTPSRSSAPGHTPAGNSETSPTDTAPKEPVSQIRRVTTAIEMLKKIAPRLVMETDEMEAPEEATDLYTVLGNATGVKTGVTSYGPWTALIGQFEVIRAHDGKRFVSGQAHLPEPYNTMLASEVISQLQPDENGQVFPPSIRFAIIVTIKPSTAPIGYEYTAKPLVEAARQDALADLRAAVAGMLPAPKVHVPVVA